MKKIILGVGLGLACYIFLELLRNLEMDVDFKRALFSAFFELGEIFILLISVFLILIFVIKSKLP
jgi:hypothetical protein